MNVKINWRIGFGLLLVLSAFATYLIHYLIFRDLRHIIIYLVGDLAFLPIQVLLVTLIVDQLLRARERKAIRQKMNMVIGTFFSDAGIELLKKFVSFDVEIKSIRHELIIQDRWTTQEFSALTRTLEAYQPRIAIRPQDLPSLKSFLHGKRDFLLRLLENQSLLEHETFSEVLWAVFHLADELDHRQKLDTLLQPDLDHLAGDIKRAYRLLFKEWFGYLVHLKQRYPYLYSLALRTNPFDPNAQPEIK